VDRYRDIDWMDVRFPTAGSGKTSVIVKTVGNTSLGNIDGIDRLIRTALLRTGAIQVVADSKSARSKADYVVEASVLEYGISKKGGGFGARFLSSAAGGIVGGNTNALMGAATENAVLAGVNNAAGRGQAEIRIRLKFIDRETGATRNQVEFEGASRSAAIPAAADAEAIGDLEAWKGAAFATAAQVLANKASYYVWSWSQDHR
jgi:hypothetical protein